MSDQSEIFFQTADFARIYTQNLVQRAAAEVNRFAKKAVRVDTGQLRNSIRTDIISDDEAEVSANTEYAAAQEYGLAKFDLPQYRFSPYMRPAASRTRQKLDELANEARRFAESRV